jgi:hypothetical protein
VVNFDHKCRVSPPLWICRRVERPFCSCCWNCCANVHIKEEGNYCMGQMLSFSLSLTYAEKSARSDSGGVPLRRASLVISCTSQPTRLRFSRQSDPCVSDSNVRSGHSPSSLEVSPKAGFDLIKVTRDQVRTRPLRASVEEPTEVGHWAPSRSRGSPMLAASTSVVRRLSLERRLVDAGRRYDPLRVEVISCIAME